MLVIVSPLLEQRRCSRAQSPQRPPQELPVPTEMPTEDGVEAPAPGVAALVPHTACPSPRAA